ncbi:MAG TPA: 3-phosphoshikimate 1-carboxyvinyltransferase, partial [Microbacterium sp.]|nr:3-phosphoshikimate 1-carboxyvinyltransferase [Microbacterium sp.]
MSANRYSPPLVQGVYAAPAAEGAVRATVTIPGSKSLTNRELIIAAIADGPGRLISPLHSDDSRRMVDALRALGVGIEEVDAGGEFGPDLVVTPAKLGGGTTIDCGQAGTVMRFIAPLAGLAQKDV